VVSKKYLVGFMTACLLYGAQAIAGHSPVLTRHPVDVHDNEISAYFQEIRAEHLAWLQSATEKKLPESFDVQSSDQLKEMELKDTKQAFLYSLVLPGAGQFYAGSKIKPALFLGAEAVIWYGYFHFHGQGNDRTDIYEGEANRQWSEQRYVEFLQYFFGVSDDEEALNEDGNLFFGHHLPDEKTQQYYEMIGKYDQFVFGWSDSPPPSQFDPSDKYAFESIMSDIRLNYEQLRNDANVAYDKATASLMVMMANHIISAFEAALSVKRHNDKLERFNAGISVSADMVQLDYDFVPVLKMTYAF
jgi:hypothetical protein